MACIDSIDCAQYSVVRVDGYLAIIVGHDHCVSAENILSTHSTSSGANMFFHLVENMCATELGI